MGYSHLAARFSLPSVSVTPSTVAPESQFPALVTLRCLCLCAAGNFLIRTLSFVALPENDLPNLYGKVDSAAEGSCALVVKPVIDTVTHSRAGFVLTADGGRALNYEHLLEACLLASTLSSLLPGSVAVSAAISLGGTAASGFVDALERALAASGLPPGDLELAFAEKDLVGAQVPGHPCFEALNSLGVRLAVREFGALAAPLGMLQHPAIETVYLDGSLARRLGHTRVAPHFPAALVSAMLVVAEYLDFKVVASGVEDAESMLCLKSLGCTLQEGSFFSPEGGSGSSIAHPVLPGIVKN